MQGWRALTVGVVTLAAIGHVALAADPAAPSPTPATRTPIVGPGAYTHPTRQFTVVIPPAAQAEERGPQRYLYVQSRRGYAITVQSGDAKPAATLAQMAGKLEAQNLGPGKRWSRKTDERAITLGGLPAIETVYEGTNVRVRAFIARGRRTDFVFMAAAPPNLHDDLKAEIDEFLARFKPAAAELPPAAAAAAPAAKEGSAKTSAVAPVPPSPTGGPMQRFFDGRFGFTIQYPGDWMATREGNYTVVFSGRPGSEAYQAMVSVQNVQPPTAKSPAEAVQAALADLKATLANSAVDLKLEAETPLVHGTGAARLEGQQFLVSYTHAGHRFRKWAVVLPRAAGNVAHIWSYTSPESRFDAFRPIAEAMLDSWAIGGGG